MTQQADYKSTLNLPKTDFAMKAELAKREPQILKSWQEAGLYEAIQKARKESEKFILHDGPPYANGDIHIGHSLNKILKDIIIRYKTMQGFSCAYVPGWDCHGMPIEHQLLRELKLTKRQVDQTSFREKARAYAKRYVDIQREQFKRLGILGDWDNPYLTMSKDYEVSIIRVFRELVGAGLVYRGRKPVYWCASCETALAEAEVEYEDKQDNSIYLTFSVSENDLQKAKSSLSFLPVESVGLVKALVWTTTPWTIPANVGLLLHPDFRYTFIRKKGNKDIIFLIEERLESVIHGSFGWPKESYEILGVSSGDKMSGLSFDHPLVNRRSRVIVSPDVSSEEGTGIVHIAPGHGEIDYILGMKNSLEVVSPVDDQGRFTKESGEPAIEGLSVLREGNVKVAELLNQRGSLIKEEAINHSYPHCWRCKQPVIFRATPQWFLRISDELREKLLDSTNKVRWIPQAGQGRMQGMLEHRPDWCLSRQRYWGSPIPVLHCKSCKEPLLDVKIIEQIEKRLAKDGSDAWFSLPAEEFAPDAACPKCKGKEFRKDTDILDVWFDSGVSHEAVLKSREQLRWPASLYLEGSDQHRGWFQVSLIPAVALHGKPPYESVLTHGFVMDGDGRKMSKSLGNVIAPQEVIKTHGADILRLWVASCDYSEDVRISALILEQTTEAYRKIRNTFRYLIANLYDFDPKKQMQSYSSMPEIDRWAMQRAQELFDSVKKSYEAYQFHQAFRSIYQFCVVDLSSFYLDALKDRLYTEGVDSSNRRCAQTALYAILSGLVRMLAPVLTITCDELWQLMRSMKLSDEASVHLSLWPKRLIAEKDEELLKRWDIFLSIRELVMKYLEKERADKVIGSPLEAEVVLVTGDENLKDLLEKSRGSLAEVFVVSKVAVKKAETSVIKDAEISAKIPGLFQIEVGRANGNKCMRCWKYLENVGADSSYPNLCNRCIEVIRSHE